MNIHIVQPWKSISNTKIINGGGFESFRLCNEFDVQMNTNKWQVFVCVSPNHIFERDSSSFRLMDPSELLNEIACVMCIVSKCRTIIAPRGESPTLVVFCILPLAEGGKG